MTRHLLSAIIFVTITGAFCALAWFAWAYVRHVHQVLLMMANSKYGYRDSVYLVRRVTRARLGEPPGKHRQTEPEKQPPLALVSAEPVEGDPTTVPEREWPLDGDGPGPATLPVPPEATITMEMEDSHAR